MPVSISQQKPLKSQVVNKNFPQVPRFFVCFPQGFGPNPPNFPPPPVEFVLLLDFAFGPGVFVKTNVVVTGVKVHPTYRGYAP